MISCALTYVTNTQDAEVGTFPRRGGGDPRYRGVAGRRARAPPTQTEGAAASAAASAPGASISGPPRHEDQGRPTTRPIARSLCFPIHFPIPYPNYTSPYKSPFILGVVQDTTQIFLRPPLLVPKLHSGVAMTPVVCRQSSIRPRSPAINTLFEFKRQRNESPSPPHAMNPNPLYTRNRNWTSWRTYHRKFKVRLCLWQPSVHGPPENVSGTTPCAISWRTKPSWCIAQKSPGQRMNHANSSVRAA